jgi:hypothetical protein
VADAASVPDNHARIERVTRDDQLTGGFYDRHDAPVTVIVIVTQVVSDAAEDLVLQLLKSAGREPVSRESSKRLGTVELPAGIGEMTLKSRVIGKVVERIDLFSDVVGVGVQ